VGIYFMMNANRVETVAVPRVIDKLQDDAVQVLEAARLQPKVVQVNGPEDTSFGRVTKQSVTQDTVVPIGTEVEITVNIGPSKGLIPDVIGLDLADAKKQLADNSFSDVQALPSPTESEKDQANEVLNVDPQPGTKVNLDTRITLYYATGKSTVPAVVGFTKDVAVSTLQNSGFSKVNVQYKETDEKAPDTVLSQSPDAGTSAKRSGTITLVVAKAPTPPPPTETPTPSDEPTG
jgi:serine/threonine-protein kinase